VAEFEKFLVFLCSGAAKAGNKKISYRIASSLEAMGIADTGTLTNLSEQHASNPALQKRMIFINDCRSGCVNVLTHGFTKDSFLYIDVSSFTGSAEFDISYYIQTEVLPKLSTKWNYSFSEKTELNGP
jgi:uncharacterized metal-binding protein